MNNLYIIGGSPRCGKTTILNEVLKRKPMIGVSSDAIRAGVRYLNKIKRIDEPNDMVEDQLPWEMLVGLIQRYDHHNIPLIVEGVVLTPERVKSLVLKNLKPKVAFVGFSSDEFIEQVIEHGKQTKDWVYEKITDSDEGEETVREMLQGLKRKSLKLKTEALQNGYQFFDAGQKPFSAYKVEVIDYLLDEAHAIR